MHLYFKVCPKLCSSELGKGKLLFLFYSYDSVCVNIDPNFCDMLWEKGKTRESHVTQHNTLSKFNAYIPVCNSYPIIFRYNSENVREEENSSYCSVTGIDSKLNSAKTSKKGKN